MTPQERSDKLAKIYEVIWPKWWNEIQDELNALNQSNCIWYSTYSDLFDMAVSKVNIGDCLDWYEKEIVTEWCKYNFSCYFEKDILWKWKSKRLPIDEQSEECIDYIYSLIK